MSLSEEMMNELLMFDESGMHQHSILHDVSETASDGAHAHVWFFPDEFESEGMTIKAGTIWISSWDGAHYHPISGGQVGPAAPHRHGIRRGRMLMSTEAGGAHQHTLGVRRTAMDGPHPHTVMVNDLEFTSLMPADLLAMIEALTSGSGEESESESESESEGGKVEIEIEIERVNRDFAVTQGGRTLSLHKTKEGALKAKTLHAFFLRCGLDTAGQDIFGVAWLAKSTAALVLEKQAPKTAVTGGGLLGKMDQLLKDCDRPTGHF